MARGDSGKRRRWAASSALRGARISFEKLEDRALLASPYPLEQTFSLHSLAGSNRTIYLDFDGHTTTGTDWNTTYAAGQPIVSPAFNFEGDGSTFSAAEREQIQRMWQRVSEDYIPFGIDVTTEDPGFEALRRSGAGGDTQWGQRVVITVDSSWYFPEPGAGGVAFTGSFTSTTGSPVFVFAHNLSFQEKPVAEAASHEAGHSLGLKHDGRSSPSEEYYAGHGSGETGWAPLMGNPYAREITQFSKGEYQNAWNPMPPAGLQDDLAIITGPLNGVAYRSDDHGGAQGSATGLTGTPDPRILASSGIIERNTDWDYFSFQSAAVGPLTIRVEPFRPGPNLDVKIDLYNAQGGLISSADPADDIDAEINVTVGAGTYYLRVQGAGNGNPLTTGYSNYASLGRYTITATLPPPPGPLTLTGTGLHDDFYLRLSPSGTLLVWHNAPASGAPTAQHLAGTYTSITVNAFGADDVLTIDHANGNPLTPAGLMFNGGPGIDELIVVGSGGADQIVTNTTGVTVGAGTASFTSIESLTASAGGGDDVLTLASVLPFMPLFHPGEGVDVVNVNSGAWRFDNDLGADGGAVAIFVADGATAIFNASQEISELHLQGSGRAELTPGGKIIRMADLTISNQATLDLRDGDLLLIAQTPQRKAELLALANAKVASARNSATPWGGAGITSASARDDFSEMTTLAVVPAPDGVLVKYTWNGDGDGDGRITSDDYKIIDRGFLQQGDLFHLGDFDFNQLVNLDDYGLIDGIFWGQTGLL